MKKDMLKCMLGMLLVFMSNSSCKKIEVDQGFTNFGEVYFIGDQSVSYNLGNLLIKYNGNLIELQNSTGRIRVPEGEAKFEFYNKSRNELIGEKTVNIVPGSPEKYNLFQPSEEHSITFLNPNGQINEEAAPEGYLKIKIANYAIKALPHAKYDIRVEGNDGWNGYLPIDTIMNIGVNLDEETYHLVKKGENNIAYRFSYLVHGTQEEVLNARGTLYTSGGVWDYPNPKKDVFTFFLSESHEADLEGASNAAKGRGVIVDGKYIYRITPNILFAD